MTPLSNPALVGPGAAGPPPAGPAAAPTTRREAAKGAPSFADALASAGGETSLVFSKHALARIERRGIALDAAGLDRLADGVGRAAGKGSRSSLVLVDDTAFVVAVPNRTVLTAVGAGQMKDSVFTNIDSAVIA